MKKNTRTISSLVLAGVTVSSIALALHFNSLAEDYKDSHMKLNAKYQEVLVENEELRDSNIIFGDQIDALEKESKKSNGLLEQSQKEIERLNTENDNLQGKITEYKEKVAELEKKFNSAP